MLDNYYPCYKCNCWIPSLFQEVHGFECHQNGSSSFTHPYIKDCVMRARVIDIKLPVEEKSQNTTQIRTELNKRKKNSSLNSSPSARISALQPDWLSNFSNVFNIALVNAGDLLRCNIKSNTVVKIDFGEDCKAQLALTCNQVEAGVVQLYKKALSDIGNKEDMCNLHSNVTVSKADAIVFETEKQCNSTFSTKQLILMLKKKYLFNNFLPLEFFNIGKKIYIKWHNNEYIGLKVKDVFGVEDYKQEIIDASGHNDSQQNNRQHSDAKQGTESPHKSGHTFDKSVLDGSALCSPYPLTSTPIAEMNVKRFHSADLLQNMFAKLNCRSFSAAENEYYILDKTTKIYINGTEKEHHKEELHKSEAFGDICYMKLKKLLKRKFYDESADESSDSIGVMLSGSSGLGKSSMVQLLCQELELELLELSVATWVKSGLNPGQYTSLVFKRAKNSCPCVILLEGIDCLFPVTFDNHKESEFTEAVLSKINELKTSISKVFIIGTTDRPHAVSERFRRQSRLRHELSMQLPTMQQKAQILQSLLHKQCKLQSQQLQSLVQQTLGFSRADLESGIRWAWMDKTHKMQELSKDSPLDLQIQNLINGMKMVVPSILRDKHRSIPKTTWNDIHGYCDIKSKLQNLVDGFGAERRASSVKGLLLYGPPGCSKTMLVKAMVHQSGFTFISIRCSSIISKYYGETEKALSKIFKEAIEAAPSLIFMDEVDSLCNDRTNDSTGFITELLSQLQLISSCNILLVAATNRPFVLDEALFSRNRFECVLHVPLPNCRSRCEMWRNLLQYCTKLQGETLQQLCDHSTGFSGAEIKAVYEQTIMKCHSESGLDQIDVIQNLLINLQHTEPRTSPSLLKAIEKFHNSRCQQNL